MLTIIIALFAIVILLIQKAESTVSNEYILQKIDLFHSKMGSQISAIVNDPYAETRQRSTKWITFLFLLIAFLHYVSEAIFGSNSVHNLLSDHKMLIFITIIMIIITGHYNRRDLLKLGLVIVFVTSLMIYAIHNNMGSIGGIDILLAELPIGRGWKDTFVILGGIVFFAMIVLIVLLARFISYILYLIIRSAFKLCLRLGPKKPLKVLIILVECITIFGIAIMSVL